MDERLLNNHASEKPNDENYSIKIIKTNQSSISSLEHFNPNSNFFNISNSQNVRNPNLPNKNNPKEYINFPTFSDFQKKKQSFNNENLSYNYINSNNNTNVDIENKPILDNIYNNYPKNDFLNRKYQSHANFNPNKFSVENKKKNNNNIVINNKNEIPEKNYNFYKNFNQFSNKNRNNPLVTSKSNKDIHFKFGKAKYFKENPFSENNLNNSSLTNNSHLDIRSNFKKVEYHKTNKLHIIDNIIENLSFTKQHLAIILICVFDLIMDGYLCFLTTKASVLTHKLYNWNKSNNLNFFIFHQFFLAIGAIISTNTRSIYWDVSSNMLVSLIGGMSLTLIHFYQDLISFCTLISIYSICHGFISNICTNYLIEIANLKYRNFFYMFVQSFKIFGMLIGVGFVYAFSINDTIETPSVFTIGLPVGEFILTFLLFFNIDSLRVLFYCDEIGILYDNLQDMNFLDEFTGVKYFDLDLHKKNFVIKLDNNQIDVNLDLKERNLSNNSFSYNNYEKKALNLDYSKYETSKDETFLNEDMINDFNYINVPGRNSAKINMNELKSSQIKKFYFYLYIKKISIFNLNIN